MSDTSVPTSISCSPVITIVENALLEDLGLGDLTTDNLPTLSTLNGEAVIRTRQACTVSGLDVAEMVFRCVNGDLAIERCVENGHEVEPGASLMTVTGCVASILKAERTALNFMQHLSGIATETRRYAERLKDTRTRLTHTRKTTPGLRLLENQAVLDGGGYPHRFNLGTAVMLKDNHLQAIGRESETPIAEAVRQLRKRLSHTVKVEVEADTLAQVAEAVEAGADIILLDNMTPGDIREALLIIENRAISEASGGITLETIRSYAETGVDYISTSKITLGVTAIDIGLDF